MTSLSGCHGGSTISLCLLVAAVLACAATGDESSTMGFVIVAPVLSECILMLDGRLMGESVVVKRRLRSELLDGDESVRGGGRDGSVYREEEGIAPSSEAAAGFGMMDVGCWLALRSVPSLRKSIHVSRSWAKKCDATTPCEWCLELLPIMASRAPSVLLIDTSFWLA